MLHRIASGWVVPGPVWVDMWAKAGRCAVGEPPTECGDNVFGLLGGRVGRCGLLECHEGPCSALRADRGKKRAAATEEPQGYVVDADTLEEALGQLMDQVRERDPSLTSIKAEFADGAVATLKVKGPKPKRHRAQVGPTVNTTRPVPSTARAKPREVSGDHG